MTSSFLMKPSFSQNQIFDKKRISYVGFFLVLCLTPFVADITFITLLLSQIYVCTTSYRLFNVPGRKWWHQQSSQHILKIYVINVTKHISKLLCAEFPSNWTNIKKIRDDVPMAPPTEPIWPQKRPTFAGSLCWQVWN